jgi:hypothetical protein
MFERVFIFVVGTDIAVSSHFFSSVVAKALRLLAYHE